MSDAPADAHRTALLDWLACAAGGAGEPAARAAAAAGDGLLDRVAALGAAGHVLDFDDTYLPGIAHLSAPVAPAAVVVGANTGATVGAVLDAYAAGFEAMGALARASHPGLYDRGFHPTAACGAVGAAVAAARLLGAPEAPAIALALLRSGGLRAAFGSDGKALQVGLAAAAGVASARLAAAGADLPRDRIAAAWSDAYGGTWAAPGDRLAVAENWIKAWPCCLQTHGAIECAATVDVVPDGPLTVLAHPVSRQAAGYDDVETPLQAKFSIPYVTAYTLLHGPPDVASFSRIDEAARRLAADRIAVATDPTFAESEFALLAGSEEVARVEAARGSPARPLTAEALAAKLRGLAGTRLDGVLDDPAASAADVLAALGATPARAG
jgi:2-methylcitrate dehydratase PrpD